MTSANLGPKTAVEFSGGIVFIVSGLTTYLERGSVMAAPAPADEAEPAAAA